MGFVLFTPVDTAVDSSLKNALNDFKGPRVKINSLRRHSNKASAHYCGKAVDLQFCPNLIAYLVSEEGEEWRKKYGVTFYIEGRPGSKKVKVYEEGPSKAYVFYNPRATGDHVHLEI
jgi:hypothetical protein